MLNWLVFYFKPPYYIKLYYTFFLSKCDFCSFDQTPGDPSWSVWNVIELTKFYTLHKKRKEKKNIFLILVLTDVLLQASVRVGPDGDVWEQG